MRLILALLVFISAFFSFQPQSFAIERFLMTCKGALEIDVRTYIVSPERRVMLSANQVFLRGRLSELWETGMEDQTVWLIEDEWLRNQITPNSYHYRRHLKNGDQLFILNQNGTLYKEGYYGEKRVSSKVTFLGREIDVAPNFPMLFADRELTKVLLDDKQMTELFATGAKAAAVKTLSPEEKKAWAQDLVPGYERYLENLRRQDRMVRVGNRRYDFLSHFEKLVSGELVLRKEEYPNMTFDPVTGGLSQKKVIVDQYFISSDGIEQEIKWGDRLWVTDAEGEVLLHVDLRVDAMPRIDELKAKLKGAAHAVVIRVDR